MQRLTEVLGDFNTHLAILSRVLVRQVGRFYAGTIPLCGEPRTDDALAIERLRDDAKQALQQRTTADADTITKVAITLSTGRIVMTNLTEVGRTLSVVHLIHDVGFHQLVALVGTSGLKVSQRRVHHFGSCHIIDAPGIGHPVAG